MINLKIKILILTGIILKFYFIGCGRIDETKLVPAGREPVIEPDYSGVTIPVNIAPMNFKIIGEGKSYLIRIKSSGRHRIILKSGNGNVTFPFKLWKHLLAENSGGKIEIEIISHEKEGVPKRFDPVIMYIADEPVDPWLFYRLLYPGYESWKEMKIVQRSTGSYRELPLIENQVLDYNCINCHSFRNNQADKFLLHVRGSCGGTYFVDGTKVTRKLLRTDNMKANVVYPAWHPSGDYVAFSSNKTVQSFHMLPGKNIEVSDLYSSIVLYDTENNTMSGFPDDDTAKYMETFPCWSPDGSYLYYCRAAQATNEDEIRKLRYDLARRPFDTLSGNFGKAEIVLSSSESGKSVSFPSISPDGKYLILTLHDYGTFSIWHKEADLYLLNLNDFSLNRLSVNSNESESYHSWSSNGRWIVFSSKRGDGLTARPYFAYFTPPSTFGKPFVLPQKNPEFYKRFPKTFNRPELVSGKAEPGPRDFMKAARKDPVKTVWKGDKTTGLN